MKVSIPSMGEKVVDEIVCEHFGMAPSYTIIDTKTGDVKTLPVTSGCSRMALSPPDMLFNEGVDVVLCGGLSFGGVGLQALERFEELGMEVYVGAIGTVRDALRSYQSNTLERANNVNTCCECKEKTEM